MALPSRPGRAENSLHTGIVKRSRVLSSPSFNPGKKRLDSMDGLRNQTILKMPARELCGISSRTASGQKPFRVPERGLVRLQTTPLPSETALEKFALLLRAIIP
jgi:hypothetical protein